jgi:hypothetical protein
MPECFLQLMFLDLLDYTYYFVPAPWLSCKLLRLLQLFPPPSEQARLVECLETILNKVQEAPKSKKIGCHITKVIEIRSKFFFIISYACFSSFRQTFKIKLLTLF